MDSIPALDAAGWPMGISDGTAAEAMILARLLIGLVLLFPRPIAFIVIVIMAALAFSAAGSDESGPPAPPAPPNGPEVTLELQGPSVRWNWPSSETGFYNVDQRLTVLGHDRRISRLWGSGFGFFDSSCPTCVGGASGYLGLQLSTGKRQKSAVFTIFGANGHSGPRCGQNLKVRDSVRRLRPHVDVLAANPHHSCRLDPYNWSTGRTYRLRVWAVGTDPHGEWFGAWVQDTKTGVDSYLGKLRVPSDWSWLYPSASWSQPLDSPPRILSTGGCQTKSRVRWNYPTANNGTVRISGHTLHKTGGCAWTDKITDGSGGVIQETGARTRQ